MEYLSCFVILHLTLLIASPGAARADSAAEQVGNMVTDATSGVAKATDKVADATSGTPVVGDTTQAVADSTNAVADATKSAVKNATDSGGTTYGVDPVQDQADFLAAHNKARIHARQTPYTWDTKLEDYAKWYGWKRATTDCALTHSDGPYGENIFWGKGQKWKVKSVVGYWVREHRWYHKKSMTCDDGKQCGHYTQIVWRDSERIGCAMVPCDDGNTFGICSYDPPGNYVGENPFEANNIKFAHNDSSDHY